jgi:hypothetical protein
LRRGLVYEQTSPGEEFINTCYKTLANLPEPISLVKPSCPKNNCFSSVLSGLKENKPEASFLNQYQS